MSYMFSRLFIQELYIMRANVAVAVVYSVLEGNIHYSFRNRISLYADTGALLIVVVNDI